MDLAFGGFGFWVVTWAQGFGSRTGGEHNYYGCGVYNRYNHCTAVCVPELCSM